MQMHAVVAFCALMFFLAIGDLFSTKTKAFVPALFIFIMLLMFAVWEGYLPKDILNQAGFSKEITRLAMIMIVVNMGCSLSVKELISEWKTVLIGVAAIVGVAITVLTIGVMIFDWQSAVVIAPPIVGGFVAAFEMSEAAMDKGLPLLSMVALLTLALQSFPAYFIVPTLLKIEATTQLKGYKKSDDVKIKKTEDVQERLIPAIPVKYQSTPLLLFLLALIGSLAFYSSVLSKIVFNKMGITFDISPTIFALIYGVIAGEIGLVERQSLQKANAFGYILIASLIGVMGGLLNNTPAEVYKVVPTIFGFVAIALIGIGGMSVLVGRMLGRSWAMSFAIGMNCLLGFPTNYLLTGEAVKAVTDDKEAQDYLMDKLAPTMLIGGFTTVTIGSVIFAGILKNFM